MDAVEAIGKLKKAVQERQEKGQETVNLDALASYLEQLEKDAGTSIEVALQESEHKHEWGIEMVRSGIDAGSHALKTCILISGGAAVALLAFAGSAWSALTPAGLATLGSILTRLAVAILLAGFATCVTYLCQYFFAERKHWHERAGDICQWIAASLVLAAYIAVGWALLSAGDIMSMFKTVKVFPVN
jgi:hypothetical protein